jgi:hypothetical protein
MADRHWFVSLDGNDWLEVADDPCGYDGESVRDAFEPEVAPDGTKSYHLRIARRQLRLWGASIDPEPCEPIEVGEQ